MVLKRRFYSAREKKNVEKRFPAPAEKRKKRARRPADVRRGEAALRENGRRRNANGPRLRIEAGRRSGAGVSSGRR